MLTLIALVALVGSLMYAIQTYNRYQSRHTGDSESAVTTNLGTGPRVYFRNTAMGEGYGHVASVRLEDPAGARQIGGTVCDRVDFNAGHFSCMVTQRGIPTTFETQVFDNEGHELATWPLPGVPSRTRVSDSGLIATTAFVTGHSYATDSFSTETTVRAVDGRNYGNLEEFKMFVDGKEITAVDRNIWGVTFAGDDEFFATMASGGKTWLMKGSFSERTMSSIMENAECPSLSPDGKKVAYKKRVAGSIPVHWDVAVLDLASKEETHIPLERSIDDQIEWLDDETMIFGQPRENVVGDSDVLSLRAKDNAVPEVFIEHAWSPSVSR